MLLSTLKTYLKPYWGSVGLIVLFQLISTGASLYLPSLNAQIIDDGVAKGDTATIWSLGAIMLGVSAVQILCQITAIYFGAKTAMGFGRDIRAAIFDRVLSFSSREVNQFGAPSLITRTTNDVQQVQQLVMMTAFMIVQAPIMMIGGLIMALREDIGLSWLIAVAVLVMGGIIGLILLQALPLFRSMQTRIDTLNRVLREQISGLRVIRAFVREPYESERFAAANRDLTDTSLRVGRRMLTLFPVVQFVMAASSVGVMWFGGLRVDAGEMQIGQLTAYLTYLTMILMSVMMSTMMLMIAPRAQVCAQRIQEVLRTRSSVVPPSDGVTETPDPGRVVLDRVTFSYPGAEAPVLHDISFAVEPGQTTAIIGSTGAGKTTLVSLIPRLFDATEGAVSVDGVDVTRLDPQILWGSIGLVPQKPYLFTGTVASNLRYGKPDATDEELWHALEVAQARDFVEAMPGQLDAPIAQGGTNVSGGQRQRLSIARALVRRPHVYIFDDSFSALDVTTDARLRAALAGETRDAAVVIVGQRVATIAGADQIIVLDDGRIEGIGTHEQLLATCPTYVEIVESQFTSQEAA
ncbi:MAG TPA: ABC transporter ATP-binding protein [Propioniciclava sp.]|jgi:ATP-binding cassette subfamily B multidrug efflux pump|uniref:ABC transporter ATP-binding protein n=1 Tax=Propioniciclava sp. TaxID=2038686 RepID=UPI002C316F20|nr:ABC transporter ATP-binding protein [Propioniciclava sp.]HRL48982.1 ABC transporter ATP-binding protein [Propioniciclava sp.]HRL80745.1 ABC transporter ATP-binding protein [Propioniciclava sp.]